MEDSVNPVRNLVDKGQVYNSTDNEYFASSVTSLLRHAFSMSEKIPFQREQQFVIPEAYIEFLQMLDNDTIAPLPGEDMYLYGFFNMVTLTFSTFKGEGFLSPEPVFWLEIGVRGDRGNFFLCCDKASELYGKVGEFYDSSPFRDIDDFYEIGTDFADFCQNMMDGKVR